MGTLNNTIDIKKLKALDQEVGQLSVEVGNIEISLVANTMDFSGNTPITLPANTKIIEIAVYNEGNIGRGVPIHIETDWIESKNVNYSYSNGYYVNTGNNCVARIAIKKVNDDSFELYLLYSGLNGQDLTSTSEGKAIYRVALAE